MAKQIIIPVTDHDSNCTQYYIVEWKLSTDTAYNSFQWYTPNIEINNLLDSATYDIRYRRMCCNNVLSNAVTLSVNTNTDSPLLPPPTGFELVTEGSLELRANWDLVLNADDYVIELSTTSDFAIITNTATIADPGDTYLFTGLTNTTYYGRIKSEAPGYASVGYSFDTAVPNP